MLTQLYQKEYDKQENQLCKVCGLKIPLSHFGQINVYHKKTCKQLRYKILTQDQKEELKTKVKQVYGIS